ncbi:hypothetical protein ILUMI_01295 [Ignelater luminosus]|uniref:General transcription factor 3C polypeptide 5 n=1 Tax=Ignelater luminosus TaxID=2038154 RepID=A0A8K0DKJ8_IGNLU|nr:hypothetical protein ILUMI_01295 [Ignelater luminosus]
MTEVSSEVQKDVDETNTKYIVLNKSTIHNPPHFANLSRKLLCIEYPGMVENVDRMIETLGGMHSIEMAVGNHNRRLELRFRPDDIFSKPCWGDKEFNPGVLVKITVRKPKVEVSVPSSSKNNDVDPDHSTTYHYQVMGVTAMTFRFTRMCDFQYLPLLPTKKWENSNSECRNIYENIIPTHLPTLKWLQSDDSCNMPLFLPPPLFAKFNSSKENKLFYERYKYYEKVLPEVAERLKKDSRKKQDSKHNAIDRTRAVRKVNSIFVNFNSKDVTIPQGPREGALNAIRKRGLDAGSLKKIQQLFQERPIWSKSALLHKSGVRNDQLKAVLPAVAYYSPNGPWRVMWCRYGYDPRLDPTSRIYQTFDFRIRASVGLKVKVQAKRSYSSNLMHYRAGPVTTDKFSLKDCSNQKSKSKPPVDETFYILKPNMLPPARQMFYQYCDVQLPEIQNMLAKLPETTKDLQYHQKNGWLPNGFHDQCREIVNKYVTIQVKELLLEDKKKKDEEQSTFSTQKVEDEKDDKQEDTVDGTIDDLIVIDDDDSTGNREDSDENQSGMGGGDELDGNMEMSDSEDDNDRRGANEDEDIDLDAVEEINKIIGSMNEPSTSAQENYEEKEDSEDEFDPELINLYHKLIVSNSEPEKKLP